MDTELKEMFDAQKLAYTDGYQTGWNDCLDDVLKQLKEEKKLSLQYYGKKELD